MSTYQHDDRKFAIFFTVVGFVGLPGALVGLYVFGSGLWPFGMAGTHTTSASSVHVPVFLTFTLLVAAGVWLLRQYVRRARSRLADVPDETLWKISALHNGALLFGALSLFGFAEVVYINAFIGCTALWFGFLFLLSTIAAVRAGH
jgi:hypothetical protein